jgi:hypothetical protein
MVKRADSKQMKPAHKNNVKEQIRTLIEHIKGRQLRLPEKTLTASEPQMNLKQPQQVLEIPDM